MARICNSRAIAVALAGLLGLTGTVALAGAASQGKPGPRPPNILMITICTLRYDHVGCYGYWRETTPNIDRLASEGARFDRMIASSSWTMPSIMSMFTSLPPTLHGATSYKRKLADEVTTLAAELRKAGYQTAGVISNPTANSKFGFGRGFGFYDDYTVAMSSELNLFGEFGEKQSTHSVPTSAIVNRVAVKWLERKRLADIPFFLFLLYWDPHWEYDPPPPYDRLFTAGAADTFVPRKRGRDAPASKAEREFTLALYDGDIRYTDEQVGRMLSALEGLGLSNNTLVFLVVDHGEEFWDHGRTRHGHTLFDELVHVPCVIRWPGHVKPGSVVRNLVSHEDVMPTLLEAAGVRAPRQCRGHSLLRLLRGGKSFPRTAAYLETQACAKNLRAARTETAKVVWDVARDRRLAFDLKADPSERHDLAGSEPVQFTDLAAELEAWWGSVEDAKRAAKQPEEPDLDPELIRRLKELGYMQ